MYTFYSIIIFIQISVCSYSYQITSSSFRSKVSYSNHKISSHNILYASSTDKKPTTNDSPLVKKLTNVISYEEIQYHLDYSDLTGMEALLPNTKSKLITTTELLKEWKKLVTSTSSSSSSSSSDTTSSSSSKTKKSPKQTSSSIILRKLLPNLYSENELLELESSEATQDDSKDTNKDEIDEVYLTETELIRLWQENSFRPFGKKVQNFHIKESLLLLPDDDEEDIMGEDSLYELAQLNGPVGLDANNKLVKSNEDHIIDDPVEYLVTTEVSLQFIHYNLCRMIIYKCIFNIYDY